MSDDPNLGGNTGSDGRVAANSVRSAGYLWGAIVALVVWFFVVLPPMALANNSNPHLKGGPGHPLPLRAVGVDPVPGAPVVHLNYYGGRVVSSMQVVQVLYGTGNYLPEVSRTSSPSTATFYAGVLNSSYIDWLSEYDTRITALGGTGGTSQSISRGRFMGQFTITPSAANGGPAINDSQIQDELAEQIAAGNLPAPSIDLAGNNNNTYYAVFFPHGVTITDETDGSKSCVDFCAYHGTVGRRLGVSEFYYGVHPDMQEGSDCEFGCGDSLVPFENVTAVASHEMIETITDPEVGLATDFAAPLAWYDPENAEIGDICSGVQGEMLGGDGVTYTVQREWSNVANACIVSGGQGGVTFTVDGRDDDDDATPGDGICATSSGKCGLRAAIDEANSLTGADTVIVPAGFYSAISLPSVTDDLTIVGAGETATVLDGEKFSDVLEVDKGATLTISRLTIHNGDPSGLNTFQGTAIVTDVTFSGNSDLTFHFLGLKFPGFGGGFYNAGNAYLTNVTFTGNRADVGGGLYNDGGFAALTNVTFSRNRARATAELTLLGTPLGDGGGGMMNYAGTATLTNVTFVGNRSGFAGGALRNVDGTISLTNVTFSGNRASRLGGGLANSSGDNPPASVSLVNVTFAGNRAGRGGTISNTDGTVTLVNSIVQGGTQSCDQSLTSLGHNIDAGDTCGFNASGDQIKTNPKLGDLSGTGRAPQTARLRPGSPAIDAGDPGACPATDERGLSRADGQCDVGAYEVQP